MIKGDLSKYHYFYKITNLINNHFYYGVHNTNNINDGYMGSGKRLHIAYKKYGIENFKKEILKYFDTAKEAFEYEADYITEEIVADSNCYNIEGGGKGWNTLNMVAVKDKNGNCMIVHYQDPRYLNGDLVGVNAGFVRCIKKNDSENRCIVISKDQYNKNEYMTYNTNKVTVKDIFGKVYLVSKDDERYTSGKLVPIWKDKHHKEETKQKMSLSHQKNGDQRGEKNSQFGTCWIHNNEKSIKIKKEQLEEYISNGWIKGRKSFIN